jgi:hypothetical protein
VTFCCIFVHAKSAVIYERKNSLKGICTSLENFGFFENIETYPLYAISNILLKVNVPVPG